jgi:glutamine---fructose-6-phosphate transaminase (isomerizing)
MCGISGYLGFNSAFSYIIKGLLMLQNRGYDSAGICTVNKTNKFVIHKYASTKTLTALDLLPKYESEHNGNISGIGHTRWATHGAKTDANAHPHIDYTGKISVVHNGIIENFYDLKKHLEENNIKLQSQTDTEVIANLISIHYQECNHMEEAIVKTTNMLKGTWGLVVMCADKPDNLYCARHGSPLLIGFGGDFLMVASEQTGFAGFVNNYVCLENNDIVVLRRRKDKITFEKMKTYDLRDITVTDLKDSPEPFPHWTIKEIEEQYEAAIRAISLGGRLLSYDKVMLGGLHENIDDLMKLDHIIILGCGTSFHAGLFGINYFKNICDFTTVQLFNGAEFSHYDIPKKGNTGIILLSQSGETKDLYRCIAIGKEHNLFMMGIVNVVDSMIAREVHCGIYLNAGREVGVASTKCFTSQLIVLCMTAVFFAQIKGINSNKRKHYLKGLHQIAQDIRNTINNSHEICKEVANFLAEKEHCFVLGKDKYRAIAKEGSLKMKEIGYIHAEPYGLLSLRHGPYSLIEDDTPILILAPDNQDFQTVTSVIEEINSRKASIIVITDSTKKIPHSRYTIKVSANTAFKGLLLNIPMQLISYYMALAKGHNPDFPKHLAKCVSV